MDDTPNSGRSRGLSTVLALALLLATTLASVWLARPATVGAVRASACAVAAGTLAMAFLLAPRTPYPRSAFLGVAVLLAAVVPLSTFTIPQPSEWVRHAEPLVWMHPWLILVMGTSRARKSGLCATTGARGGWMLLGVGVVLSAITLTTLWVVRLI